MKEYNFELLRAIKEKGWTQRDFAQIVGEHPSKVSRIITGTWNPSTETQIKYSKVLKMNRDFLFRE